MVVFVHNEGTVKEKLVIRLTRNHEPVSLEEFKTLAPQAETFFHEGDAYTIISEGEFEPFIEKVAEYFGEPTVEVHKGEYVTSDTFDNPKLYRQECPELIHPASAGVVAQAYQDGETRGMRFEISPSHTDLSHHIRRVVASTHEEKPWSNTHVTQLVELYIPTPHEPFPYEIHNVLKDAIRSYGKPVSHVVSGKVHKK